MDRVRHSGKALAVSDKVLAVVRVVSARSRCTLVEIASAL
jgi:hypothetical protein